MLDKVLLGVSFVLVVLLFIAYKVVGGLYDDKAALEAEKARIEIELQTTNADLEKSKANSDRMLTDKVRIIDTLVRQRAELEEANRQDSEISKDIANADDTRACIESPPVRAVLRGIGGLRNQAVPGDQGRADDPVRPAQGGGAGDPVPARATKGPRPGHGDG
jgi:hypothetical protein